MKSKNTAFRALAFSALGTMLFLGLAVYAGYHAFKSDPELTKKIEKKFNFHVDSDGFQSGRIWSDSSRDQTIQESWTFQVPHQRISLKSFAGNILIKETSGDKVVISAEGALDMSKAEHLIETELTGSNLTDILTIREPSNQATRDLQIQILVPTSFKKDLEVSTVGGQISIENAQFQELELKSVSGDLLVKQVRTHELSFKSISGNVFGDEISAAKISGKSVSGNVEIKSLIPADLELSSVSGNFRIELASPSMTSYSLRSVSGKITNPNHSARDG